ncbi:Wzz/FepE/Etk N-terminal domain-containing protein [Cysteiniphilum sp. 6C5]|uniref:Wzz/FepE/Etk N-terminal domain-containing protein n=1 Tax=unclassified Cysteiniphilum TaxID=2610889 RepID=UPI003F838D64
MSQQDNDIISISDLLVTLIKHIKLWFVLVVLGAILSIVYGIKHQDNYEYSAYLLGPSYIDNGQLMSVMGEGKLSKLIDIYYKQYQDNGKSSEDKLKDKMQFDVAKLMLHVKAKYKEQGQVNELFTQFIAYIQKQQQYINNINNWQKNVEFNLAQLQQQNKVYGDTVNQFQHNMDSLTRSQDLATVNGQALLNNLSNTILSYQNQMFSNNITIQHYKSQLKTLDHSVLIYGGMIRSYKPVGLTSPMIIVLGIILSLILATIIVFMVEFVRNLRQEVKQKMAK